VVDDRRTGQRGSASAGRPTSSALTCHSRAAAAWS
jgi:hypothetical protein